MNTSTANSMHYYLKIVTFILLVGVMKAASASAQTSLTQEIMADGVISAKEEARYLKHIGIQAVISGNKRIKVVPTSPGAS